MTSIRVISFLFVLLQGLSSFASMAFNGHQLQTKMEAYIERGIVIMNLTNNTNKPLLFVITPGEDNNLVAPKPSDMLAIGPRSTMDVELKFDGTARDLIAVVDYDVTYGPRGFRPTLKAFNPMQYLLRQTAGWKKINARAQSIVNQKYVKNRREEPTRDGVVDLGAGLKVRTRISFKDFPVVLDDRVQVGRPIEVLPPKLLAGLLPYRSLPKNGVLGIGREETEPTTPLKGDFAGFDGPIDCGGVLKCITGELHIINTLNEGLTPGWGWRAEAWDVSSNPWKLLASTEVDGQGKWILPIGLSNVTPDDQYYIVYKTSNRYIEVRDPITNLAHQWGFMTNTYANKKAVIMPNKSLVGVGRVFSYSNQLWHKLSDNEINAIGKNQNIIYYPNVLDAKGESPCTYGDPKVAPVIAWSCSYGGSIYLIPDHSDRETVVHELGHNLHYLFWGKFISPGGDHNYGTCYAKELAITEGFSNFLMRWAWSPNNTTAYPNKDAESYLHICEDENKNDEMSVAAGFWDLYDNIYDTRLAAHGVTVFDKVLYNTPSGMIADFLADDTITSMDDFRKVLTEKYKTVRIQIDSAFDMNDSDKVD